MNKSKSKIKGLFKGVAVGFAFVMCSAFFPVNALASAVKDYTGIDEVKTNTNRLQVGEDAKVTETRVKKGQTVTIPSAEYKYKDASGSEGKLPIKCNQENKVTVVDGRDINATVKVFYQATNDEVKINTDSTFTADRVGRYVILFTVVDGEDTYTYDMLVQCEASDVTFDFQANNPSVVPSIYDRAIADKKDVVLPLPTVEDEDGEEILTADDNGYYTTNKEGFNDPATDPTQKKNACVEIRLASNVQVGTGEDGDTKRNVTIKERDVEGKKEFYIDGKDLDYESVEGKTFQIIYSYYTVSASGAKIFISSTSKSFTVDNGYYYHSDPEDGDNGLDLTPSWSSSYSDLTAVVGVERELPKITASTSADNSPASESVDVYYTIQAFMKGSNSKYDIEVTNDNEKIDVELLKKGTFKSKVEGSFRFVYNVQDFYGNTINTSKTSFTIDNVKDTRAANVYAYDGLETSYNEKDNTYTSVDTKIKNRSVNRNIIFYAVGGTDNMVARDKLILKREIRDNTTLSKYIIGDDKEEEIYNSYNLIFAPKAESGTDEESVLKQIITDNYELKRQMVLEGKSVSDVAQIKTFLKEKKFLLVTTEFNKDVAGNDIVTGLTEEDEQAREKMMRTGAEETGIGYAYIEPQNPNRKDFTEPSITLYYYASDGINSETRKLYTVNLASGYTDNAGPTLTFPTDLQAAYLPTDKIEFNVATATDTQDTRLDTVTAYRFLDKTKKPVESELTTGKLRYVIGKKENLSDKDNGKWYTTETESGNGLVESEGWYFDTTKTSYTIDLADDRRPATAEYVEILAYTIDDDGNAGFFTKTVKIAEVVDSDMPELFLVENAPETTDEHNAPEEIKLPTLHFADKGANYMSAKVTVLKITTDEEENETRTYLQSLNMSTEFDTVRETFKVNAGYFRASTQGKYQVAVTVSDAANHSVTTYFNYDVKGGAIDDEPVIDNIASGKVDLEPGQQYYLTPPTVSIIKDDKYGYIGLDEDDDAYTATNYTTTVTAANADYTLDQFYFSAAQRGSFTLMYKVYILRYDKENVVEESAKENGKFFFNEGKLKYRINDEDYFVYIDRENEKVVANTKLTIGGTALADGGSDYNTMMESLHLWVEKSNPIQINVGGVEVEVQIDEDYYNRSYETPGEKLEIIKPNTIKYNGEGYSTNNKESTVTITKTVKGTTTTLASLNFEEWNTKLSEDNAEDFEISQENTENKKVVLKLKDNGVYHIRYSIQAQDRNQNNVGEPKILEYDISNGDTVDPKLTLGKKLTEEKYKIGDTMTLNLAAITVSDTVTTDVDKLLSTLKVTIQNTTLNEGSTQIYNTAEEEGKLKFEYKLEQAGTYTLNISVEDEAGNTTTRTFSFEVTADEKSSVDVKEVMGGVLIGLSVAILAGVVIYFVVSKVKLDKKEKRYKE